MTSFSRFILLKPLRMSFEFYNLKRDRHDEKEVGVLCHGFSESVLIEGEEDWAGCEGDEGENADDSIFPFVDEEKEE